MLILAGLALVYPRPVFDAVGLGLVAVVLVVQYLCGGLAPART
jgi:hypothetical protein